MLKFSLLTAVFTLLFLPQANADTKYVSDTVSPLFFKELTASTVAVKVMKVIDPVTFMGDDRNVYALSGIEVPNAITGKTDITLEASKTLGLLIEGKDLKLYVTKNKEKGRLNRMNQMVVQAELKQDHIWVEGEMLAAGLARVRTTPSNPELAEQMYKAESYARDNKKGLWANSQLQVLTPETVTGHENAFEIVEGTPKAAAVTNNMIFLNYGNDYKQDFTVGIPTNLRTTFAKRGINPLQLAHTKIRVRGWVQSYNGDFIEIDHPEQIEILGEMSPFKPTPDASAEPAPGNAGMRTINLPKPPVADAPKAPEPPAPVKKNAGTPNP